MTAKSKMVGRSCYKCKGQKGTVAFRFDDSDGKTKRDYFHPKCFKGYLRNTERRK